MKLSETLQSYLSPLTPAQTTRTLRQAVDHQATAAGIPAVTRGMLVEPRNFIPVAAAIVGAEESAGIDPAP